MNGVSVTMWEADAQFDCRRPNRDHRPGQPTRQPAAQWLAELDLRSNPEQTCATRAIGSTSGLGFIRGFPDTIPPGTSQEPRLLDVELMLTGLRRRVLAVLHPQRPLHGHCPRPDRLWHRHRRPDAGSRPTCAGPAGRRADDVARRMVRAKRDGRHRATVVSGRGTFSGKPRMALGRLHGCRASVLASTQNSGPVKFFSFTSSAASRITRSRPARSRSSTSPSV